jgi:hypothetical protein
MRKASIILLNWKREKNMLKILNRESKYDSVAEILVFNNNPDVTLPNDIPKVKVINSVVNFGVYSRFAIANLATSPFMFFQDDDLILPEITLSRMMESLSHDPLRLYGLIGRNVVKGQYTPRDVDGDCDIVLTRAVAFSRMALAAVIKHKFDFINAGRKFPENNGEDIFMSLAVKHEFKKKHVAMCLPWEELDAPEALSMKPTHFEERNRVVSDCEHFFRKK